MWTHLNTAYNVGNRTKYFKVLNILTIKNCPQIYKNERKQSLSMCVYTHAFRRKQQKQIEINKGQLSYYKEKWLDHYHEDIISRQISRALKEVYF